MCSQTMMSSTETRQGFKVTKAFSVAPCNSASGLVREQHPSTQGTFNQGRKKGCTKWEQNINAISCAYKSGAGFSVFVLETQHVY